MRPFIIILCAPLLFFLLSFSHEREALKETPPERITYPGIVKIHPPVVHFAIALPVFALLLEGFYQLKGRRPDELEFLTLLLSSGAVLGAAVTGYIAHESMENLPITEQALETLHTHETLGLSLAALFVAITILRVFYTFKPISMLHHIYILLLIIGVGAILFQGNLGGKLVYDFGLGVSR